MPAAASAVSSADDAVDWSLSVISHGHAPSINRLLRDLAQQLQQPARYEIVVTINCPEPEAIDASLWPGTLVIRCNTQRYGFASNHNRALALARGRYVALLDPDLRVQADIFPPLQRFLEQHPRALITPQVADSQGRLQDNMRRLVTPARLLARYRQRDRGLDYRLDEQPQPVDWIAGLFIASTREFWAQQRGFDERFHLYCEDTELSLRCWNAGGEVWALPFNGVIHDARRRTLSDRQHFVWHCTSLLRLWSSGTFWRYLRRRTVG